MTAERIFTVKEAAEYLRVTRQMIYKLIKQGELASTKVGSEIRILESDIAGYLEKNRTTTKEDEE